MKLLAPINPKVVYLFGAGATHAELMNLHPDEVTEARFLAKSGLLTVVSKTYGAYSLTRRERRSRWLGRRVRLFCY